MGVFGKALFATPPTIAGVQLQPFSAYHAQALMELDSPFIMGGREPTAGETAVALTVCSCTRADGLGRVAELLGSNWQRMRWNVKWMFRSLPEAANALADPPSDVTSTPS